MKFSYLVTGVIVLYVILSLFNYFYLSQLFSFASTMYLIFAVILALPIVIIKYAENKWVKDCEQNFPVFLQDFVESTRGGMTLPHAFKSISNNDYGRLTQLVKKIAAQLDWGIPVETVLLNFSKETKSKFISRIISTVMESHRFGGRLTDTFEALSNTALEVEKLRAERRLYMNSQVITGYIIFFVFLAVIVGLERYLVPTLGQVSTTTLTSLSAGETAPQSTLSNAYGEIFRNLILIQGLFTGLTVGKMSEGVLVAGIKHSIFMMVLGLLVFVILG